MHYYSFMLYMTGTRRAPAIPKLSIFAVFRAWDVFGEDVGSKDAAVKLPGMGLPST
nr:hypothetical protein [Methylomarinum sp. Ch1-1]MDP4519969.1 hypothetical protein [Methylomarinum sp. Ch1-1]